MNQWCWFLLQTQISHRCVSCFSLCMQITTLIIFFDTMRILHNQTYSPSICTESFLLYRMWCRLLGAQIVLVVIQFFFSDSVRSRRTLHICISSFSNHSGLQLSCLVLDMHPKTTLLPHLWFLCLTSFLLSASLSLFLPFFALGESKWNRPVFHHIWYKQTLKPVLADEFNSFKLELWTYHSVDVSTLTSPIVKSCG